MPCSLHSTRNPALAVPLADAVLDSLAPDGGLYVLDRLAPLPAAFWDEWRDLPMDVLAARVLGHVFDDEVPAGELARMCREAFDFPVPVVAVAPGIQVVELFHGPTLAFKDFGARFMARLMGWLARDRLTTLRVLVATSGDTGGAVAHAYHGVPGVETLILFPAGRVSPLQEKQLTTLGGNVTALEVAGSFDDCQRMVKAAFADRALARACGLTSANSINIARLLPQMLYYFEAARALAAAPVFVVPSGNFGNLTAGLLAARLGLPVRQFVAATNANDSVPRFLASGAYQPRPSLATISNAMDVGAPSNFERMRDLFGGSWPEMAARLAGFAFDDECTRAAMRRIHADHGYVLDPHTAVGWLAAEAWLAGHPGDSMVVLATAHPAKFLETAEAVLGPGQVAVPERLARLAALPKQARPMPAEDAALCEWLRQHCHSAARQGL
jgi:threonine synthase